MNAERVDGPLQVYRSCACVFTLSLGLLAVGWGTVNFRTFSRQSPVQTVALRIIEREPFTAEALAAQLTNANAAEQEQFSCSPALLRSAAIIQFRIAEDAIAARDRAAIDGALADTQTAIRRSLDCSPADSFLWLGLFWITNMREGFNPRNLEYLRLSYTLGPHEGWIALIRSRMALGMFASLPDDLKEKAVDEFLAFIETGRSDLAEEIFVGPGWNIRNVLLAAMQRLDEPSRMAFARTLHDKGYDDVSVPGVAPFTRYPWQH